MAVIKMTHSSLSLGKRTNVHIYVPDQVQDNTKILYLLHGLSDNDEDWFNNTQLIKAVAGRNLIIVCPDGGKSFYSNMNGNYNYFDYIAKELPDYIEKLLPFSGRSEDRYIAGLSMGGYGAFKFALSFPERYAGAASFSGVMDVIERMKNNTFDDLCPPFCGGTTHSVLPNHYIADVRIMEDRKWVVPRCGLCFFITF